MTKHVDDNSKYKKFVCLAFLKRSQNATKFLNKDKGSESEEFSDTQNIYSV